MRGTTTNVCLILDLYQKTGLARQTAERPEHSSPAHGAITRQPMTVRVAVGILNVDVGEIIAGGIDVIVDRWRTGGNMRVMRMSGIDRNRDAALLKLWRADASSLIFVLYVFDDEFAPMFSARCTTSLSVKWTRSVSACRDPGLISRLL